MGADKYSLDNRLFIPNTAIPCKALVSWIANNSPINVNIRKEGSMIHVNFPDLGKETHEQAREFIDNWLK